MIDLHSHILPGIDDGAADLSVSLRMAQAFVADGVSVVAATPHILPGMYHNEGPAIRAAVDNLQLAINQAGIPLRVISGADVHVAPDLVGGLRSGRVLSLADTRYILIEPPHHVMPVHLEDAFFSLAAAGYVPILTHPERLTWVHERYDVIERLFRSGVWMQITSGSLRGAFGGRAQSLARQMLRKGHSHIIASDAHDDEHRPPDLSHGYRIAVELVGEEEAARQVLFRPSAILENAPPGSVPAPTGSMREDDDDDYSARRRRRSRSAGDARTRTAGGGGLFGRMRRLIGQ